MKTITKEFVTSLEATANTFLDFRWVSITVLTLRIAVRLIPNQTKLYFALARAYYESRKWDESVDAIRAAVNASPHDLNIRWALGIWLLQINRPIDALSHIQFYLETRQQDAAPYVLANIYAVLGHCCLLLKRLDDAKVSLEKAASLNPKDLDYCIGVVGLYHATGKSEDVTAFLEKFIKDNPAVYLPYAWMAHHLQYSLRNPRESLEWYKQALEKISDPEIRKYCESFISGEDKFDGLLREYIDALIACGASAIVFSEVEKYEKYKIDTTLQVKKRLIDTLVKLGYVAEAEKTIRKLPRVTKKSPEILLASAELEIKRGNLDKALGTIDAILQIDNKSHDVLDLLGSLQLQKEQWRDALETYKFLVSESPYTVNWLKNIAYCYSKIGETEKAREYYEEVIRYDKHDAAAWIDLANTYLKLRSIELAVSAYQKGLEYDWLENDKRQHALQMLDQIKTH